MKSYRFLLWIAATVLVLGMIAGLSTSMAQEQQKPTAVSAAGKEWLTLMNKDNDNTVDKKEFLDYMSAEFDKADTDHDGTLDANELGHLRMKLAPAIRH